MKSPLKICCLRSKQKEKEKEEEELDPFSCRSSKALFSPKTAI
jgi:hypothetical protein